MLEPRRALPRVGDVATLLVPPATSHENVNQPKEAVLSQSSPLSRRQDPTLAVAVAGDANHSLDALPGAGRAPLGTERWSWEKSSEALTARDSLSPKRVCGQSDPSADFIYHICTSNKD